MFHSRGPKIFAAPAVILIVALIILNFAAGCSRSPAKSPPKSTESQKKESQALKELQTDIESIIKEYEKVYLMQTAPPPKAPEAEQKKEDEQKGQDKEQQKSGQGDASSNKEQEGKQGQQESSQNQAGAPPQPDWPKFEQDIARIHEQWNSFQAEAVKSGATSGMIGEFSDTLNQLTMTLTRQELYQGLLLINDLYGKTVDFEKLFKTKSPPEIRKVLYYGRMAAYKILNNDEIGAQDAMSNALASWESVKFQVEDTNEATKVQFSLDELSQAIKEKDPNLIKIKAQIAEKNVQDVMKSIEESKKE
mgnify:CR=1 FL=1